jgi:hypothetical protein
MLFFYICVHSFCRCYTRLGSYPNCNHIKIIVKKQIAGKKKRKEEKETAQIGINLGLPDLMPDCWLEVSLHPEGPTRLMFSVVFFVLRANAELVPKFHVALHASHSALPMLTLKTSPFTNVTLTFDFGLDLPVHGVYG